MGVLVIRKKVQAILEAHRVVRAGLFGSQAQRTATRSSDVDILVEMPKTASLLDLVGLKQDLEKSLGKPVDLVEYDSIKPRLRGKILAQEVSLL